ncbi:MAG: hypothetical protein HN742_01370 [Lentisphaerae bacterium]|jgi:D-lyxose ketol-isomerase|nr:hypothetical protein [Lentisphaerota bacterium]MBT4817878.1 hypothetical protein [Lentisphaerota bacterium]MBT5612548.1 hypothetical protein [Lentisphaerota bacterium]MBT7061343.1 hypothetical protein [Lentisphaerota bacterium]MBT7840484.1 hypothetical protein [Lentisphaerota bacterium]
MKQVLRSTKQAILLVTVAAVAVLWTTGCQSTQGTKGCTAVQNEAFYQDGVFQADAAKDAYFAMMARFNYPIPAVLKTDEFWVCDFLQGQNAQLGMGGIFWINEEGEYGKSGCQQYDGEFKGQKFGYLGHEIYCLPMQALPEHRHVGGESGFGPKMEAWHVRYGEVYFFSELVTPGGKEILISELPEDERPWGYGEPWFKCKYVVKLGPGEIYKQDNAESWHFLRAAKSGAILSEYATFHNQVEFSKPGMSFACTGSE